MHTTLDTISMQHVVISMWVWLVGVRHGHVWAKITLLCYCTHLIPTLSLVLFLVLVLIIVQLQVVCVCTGAHNRSEGKKGRSGNRPHI